MQRFGAHLSISKGLPKLVEQVDGYGMTAVQIFGRNPRGRGETKVAAADAAAFRKELHDRDWKLFIHAPYYVNIGSSTPKNRRVAVEVMKLDLEKGDLLGAQGVVVHLGGAGDGFEIADGTKTAIENVQKLLKETDTTCRVLLETSAGPKKVANQFEQLAEILDGIGDTKRVGVCMDTCHMFVSGYDVTGKKMKTVLDQFDVAVGLNRVDVIHTNDTLSDIGSGLDRHYHLGKGSIGEEAFKVLVTDKRLQDMTFILETPKEDKGSGLGDDPDPKNLALLKKLAKK